MYDKINRKEGDSSVSRNQSASDLDDKSRSPISLFLGGGFGAKRVKKEELIQLSTGMMPVKDLDIPTLENEIYILMEKIESRLKNQSGTPRETTNAEPKKECGKNEIVLEYFFDSDEDTS